MLGSFSRSPLQAHTRDPNGHSQVSPARGTPPSSHRPTAICSDVMAVCSVQIEITESGDRLTASTATVVEPMLI